MFLGYTITLEGIKPCPDKIEDVLQLPSPRIIKEVPSLNRKLASLNRFLSKLAEKSLPLFKTLKKFIKKSDFHWTSEAEQAFMELKQHLLELPLLVAPKTKEELIIYLSASYGPELNYTPMEKLVLSLVFAAKRLQRAATKVEHNIMYRPRTSVKGQILMDFLVEKSDENSLDTPVMETPPKPYTLFTDGSSCVDRSGAKYEALIAGLRIVAQMGVQNVQVLVEILKEKCIQEEEVVTVIEEEETT
ncbi:hypothetical protein Tco_0896169 [Tanacetum coccineum]